MKHSSLLENKHSANLGVYVDSPPLLLVPRIFPGMKGSRAAFSVFAEVEMKRKVRASCAVRGLVAAILMC